ncbi:Centrosomal protein of 78 kDa [Geranomyces variabilis]|uniref:Centrosomal protein of 78 kDa n=1 Tax=Geranomyces variabilis TaxID=109894 RepID=A0AAD5TM73_9FUNG|nr:Centrosomal protein of 78 kDa [Geranomyces variabilis]
MPGELGTGTSVCFSGDAIRRPEDWARILLALRKNTHAERVRILSDGAAPLQTAADASARKSQRPAARALPVLLSNERVIKYLASCIKGCLVVNPVLTELELTGIPLPFTSLQLLAQGLCHATALQRFSLARCPIGDKGLFALSKPLKLLSSLVTLNFGGCQLTPSGASVLTDILNSRAVRRQAAIWECTLRQPTHSRSRSRPNFARAVAVPTPDFGAGIPKGIVRLTLCHNVLGDDGVHFLMEALVEEIGLRALDLQYNDVSDSGARIVKDVLALNKELVIVDLRSNHVDPLLWGEIAGALNANEVRNTDINTNQTFRWLDRQDPLRDTYHGTAVPRHVPKTRPRRSQKPPATSPSRGGSMRIEGRPPFKVGVLATSTAPTSAVAVQKLVKKPPHRKPRMPPPPPPLTAPANLDLQDDSRPNLIRQNAMLRRRLRDLEQAQQLSQQQQAVQPAVVPQQPLVAPPRIEQDVNAARQIETLVDLLESSLKGFHALLDRMESNGKHERHRRRGARHHDASHHRSHRCRNEDDDSDGDGDMREQRRRRRAHRRQRAVQVPDLLDKEEHTAPIASDPIVAHAISEDDALSLGDLASSNVENT